MNGLVGEAHIVQNGVQNTEWFAPYERTVSNASLLSRGEPMVNSEDEKQEKQAPTEMRVKQEFLQKMVQRMTRKNLYGFNRRRSPIGRLNGKMRSYAIHGNHKESLLAPLEQLLVVIVWRAGFVSSIEMAHHWILHGHVHVKLPGQSRFRCRTPFLKRIPGTRVCVDPFIYRQRLSSRKEELKENQRIPSRYLKVDWTYGKVVFVRLPYDNEILMPISANRSLLI